jgi:hypothetical protein
MNTFDFSGNAAIRKHVDSSRLWFAVCIPLFSLFIELYASTWVLGILVWAAAIFSLYAACIADFRFLKKQGYDVSSIGRTSLIVPPLYALKRAKLLGESIVPAIFMTAFIIYALLFNGFTAAATADEETITNRVKSNYSSNITQLADTGSYDLVGDMLDSAADGDEVTWTEKKGNDIIMITAECDKFTIEFSMEFDGYAYGDITVTKLTVDGKEYTDSELTDKLKEMLISDSDSENDSESDNSTE